MLCYTLSVKVLHSDELRTEATRLLNLLTQLGILAGVGIGMALVDSVHQQNDAGSSSDADAARRMGVAG